MRLMGLGILVLVFGIAGGQEPPVAAQPPARQAAPAPQASPSPATAQASAGQAVPPAAAYDKAIFMNPIPPDQLAFFSTFNGVPAKDLLHDKQFKKVMKAIIPNCMFHYGRDMPLDDALDLAMGGSKIPVQVRDGRYLLVSGTGGPYLDGRGFLWIDLQEGVGLGGFYFHPTNGEPTPSLVIFSRQVKEQQISMGELPPAFAEDLFAWASGSRVPVLSTRYFITGGNKRILLEHDEDFCRPTDGMAARRDCMQMNADAADFDETAAYYLDQVHYATNATAWMIGPDQVAWIGVRDRTCFGVADLLGCRIRVTREHTRTIVMRGGGGRR